MVLIRSHDALIRFVFGDPAQMAELLRAWLPAAFVDAVDWATFRRVDGTFVDKALKERRTDMLFEGRIGERPVLFHVLGEHKSIAEPWTALQMGGYSLRILEAWLARNRDAMAVPAIVPVVVYHGDEPWRAPRSLRALVDLRGLGAATRRFLRPLQLEQRYVLIDFSVLDERRLEAMRLSAVAALTIRFVQFLRGCDPDQFAAAILQWRHLVRAMLDHPRGKDVLSALFSWWLAGAPATGETVRQVMTKIQQEDAPMRSLLDVVLDMGEVRGRRSLLAEQLRAKFGELAPPLLTRIEAADAATLKQWGLRVLTAGHVEDVFA